MTQKHPLRNPHTNIRLPRFAVRPGGFIATEVFKRADQTANTNGKAPLAADSKARISAILNSIDWTCMSGAADNAPLRAICAAPIRGIKLPR